MGSSRWYTIHKGAVIAAFVCWFAAIALGTELLFAAGGLAFMLAGVSAIAGGRSLIGAMRAGDVEVFWRSERLNDVQPGARAAHAWFSGLFVFFFGVLAVGMALQMMRQARLQARRAELQLQRGVVEWRPQRLSLVGGRHGWFDALALREGNVCYAASKRVIVEALLHCEAFPQTEYLGNLRVQKLALTRNHVLWASDGRVGAVRVDRRGLDPSGNWSQSGVPRTFASESDWVVWDDRSKLSRVVLPAPVDARRLAPTERVDPQRTDVGLPEDGPIVLAAHRQQVGFGPTSGCSFAWLDLSSGRRRCVLSGSAAPLALDQRGPEVTLALADGRLVRINGERVEPLGRLDDDALAVTATDHGAFVVARRGVYRVARGGGRVEQIYSHLLDDCPAAGLLGDRFAWQLGSGLMSIRRDATPLAPYELPSDDEGLFHRIFRFLAH